MLVAGSIVEMFVITGTGAGVGGVTGLTTGAGAGRLVSGVSAASCRDEEGLLVAGYVGEMVEITTAKAADSTC